MFIPLRNQACFHATCSFRVSCVRRLTDIFRTITTNSIRSMKTRFLLAFGLAAMVCACAKDGVPSEEPSNEGNILVVKAGLDLSKTALQDKVDGKYPLVWSEGDVLVLNGVPSKPLDASLAGRSYADFEFEGTFSAPYDLVYCGKEGAADVAVFKDHQTFTEGTSAPFEAPLCASVNDLSSVTMANAAAVVKLSFTGEGITLKKIVLRARGEEPVAGEFTLGKTEGVFDGSVIAPAEGGKPNICLVLGEQGVQLAGEPVDFHIVIPAGTYSKGFNVYAVNSENKTMALTMSSLTSVETGKVYEMPVTQFVPGNILVIAEPSDMDLLKTVINDAGVGKRVILVDDIDMTGIQWTSFGSGGSVTAAGNFTGTLDGLGHTIKGLTTPLFGNLAGCVKNLTIEADITYTGNNTYYKGSDYGMGILAGYITNVASYTAGTVVVENVTTKGSLTVDRTTNHNFNVGGLVGANNGAKVVGCTNEANVTYKGTLNAPSSGTSYAIVGGVIGASQSTAPEIHELTNKGDVTVSAELRSSYLRLGGVVGQIAADAQQEIVNLVNEGKVTSKGKSSAESSHAGVVGYMAVASRSLKGLVNRGELHVSASHYPSAGISQRVGGLVGYLQATKISNSTNYGKIFIEPGYTFTFHTIAGCVGIAKSAMTLENVANEGDMEFNAPLKSVTTSWSRIGGVLGHAENISTLVVKDCHNSGNMTFNCGEGNGTVIAGGVMGNLKVNNTIDITGTYNSGNLIFNGNVTSSDTQTIELAGIVSRVEPNNDAPQFTLNITGNDGVPTNSGKIALYETTQLSYLPYAGGIVGYAFGKSAEAPCTINISHCSNTGAIDRKITGYTYVKAEYTASNRYHYAGGIAARIGSADMRISDCSNSAQIQFSKNNGTATALGSDSQAAGYAGGILGNGGGYVAGKGVVHNCTNSGNVPSIEGYAGGIVGYCWSLEVSGEKGKFCSNTGDIAYRTQSPTAYPQCTSGGILGGGSTNIKVLWCYNTGSIGGNGSCGALIGNVANINSKPVVEHCKANCMLSCGSTWAKAGFLFGFTSKQEDGHVLLANVKNCAVGGTYHYGTNNPYVAPTAENFVNHLYYNKVTAPKAAQDNAAATSVLTLEEVADKGITLWDGQSKVDWE